MAAKSPPEINAGSMADIAFLLLIFFLVTTTMDSDWGLARVLPPPPEDIPQDDIKIKERDVFVVLANANNQLLVEGEVLDITQLKQKAREFILNTSHAENLPEWEDITLSSAQQMYDQAGDGEQKKKWEERLSAAKELGNYTITKQVISLQNDRGTSYELYVQVQDELAGAYNDLRNELSKSRFGMSFAELEEKAKTDPSYKSKANAIKTVYPQRISEAEPRDANKK